MVSLNMILNFLVLLETCGCPVDQSKHSGENNNCKELNNLRDKILKTLHED